MTQLIDKSALVAEIEKTEKISKDTSEKAVDTYFKIHFDGWATACRSILSFIDTLEVKDDVVSNDALSNSLEISRYGNSHIGETLEEAAKNHKSAIHIVSPQWTSEVEKAFKAGAQWQKDNLWKDAQGEDLPEIDREVIALEAIKNPTTANTIYGYEIIFAHRPNPDGWDGKNIVTEEVEHYTPKIYDKGGWNIPNVKYWLDCELPKIEE